MNMLSSGTRQERLKGEKRARIRAAAWKLMREHGFARTTLRDVAAEADVAVGTLFLYARSKDDLARQVFYDTLAAAYARALESFNPEAGPAQALAELYAVVLQEITAERRVLRDLLRVVFFLTGEQYQASDAAALALLAKLEAPVTEWQRRGLIRRDLQSGEVVRLTFGIHVLMTVGIASNPDLPIDVAVAQQTAGIAVLFEGLTPRRTS